MVDSFTLEKLIEDRISKIDCQMQGYVLEGYPKSKEQLENLNNLHISREFTIGMQVSDDIIKSRAGKEVKPENLTKRYPLSRAQNL